MVCTPKSSSLSAGQVVGRCRVIEPIGKGGMGEVYLAEHLSLKRPVALKILPRDLGCREYIERFLKEARSCSRIEHPNVVVIHDVGEDQGLYYIIMQYVQGKNLAELLKEQVGPLPWRSALRIIQLAARGVEAVHAHGLVHRDIKPANIMLSVDSRVLLMDFGLVREEAADSSLTGTGHVVGTPAFMSPEQCRGEQLDRRSDIYSLGCTLYCLLTKSPPHQGSKHELLGKIASGSPYKAVHQLRPDVSPQVSHLVTRAMAPRREDRFPTAEAMAKEIRTLLRNAPAVEPYLSSTVDFSQASEETQSRMEPPPLELLPLETNWERIAAGGPWVAAGVVTFICLVILGLVLNYGLGGRDTGGRSDNAVPPKPAPPPIMPRPMDAANMVRIDAGFVHLGNSPAKLRSHFAVVLDGDNDLVRQALDVAASETQKQVYVPSFWIDQYEVTNAQYARFLQEANYQVPEHWTSRSPPAGLEDHPVDNIRYADAEAYARWAGKQLPTREQWMRAYRGDTENLFPWGDAFDGTRANAFENKTFPKTSPVTGTPRDVSVLGVFNLVGNVAEFIRERSSQGGSMMVTIKGAHYNTSAGLRGVGCMQFLISEETRMHGFGFRCVREDASAKPR